MFCDASIEMRQAEPPESRVQIQLSFFRRRYLVSAEQLSDSEAKFKIIPSYSFLGFACFVRGSKAGNQGLKIFTSKVELHRLEGPD